MAFEPRFRMGPSPRSFAADAHDCIMVAILPDRPNTSLWREVLRLMASSPRYRHAISNNGRICPTQSNQPAAVLATVKGKSLRDGLRPPLTAAARSGPTNLGRDEEM